MDVLDIGLVGTEEIYFAAFHHRLDFIKERMRQEDVRYGGEMSAHHYFRDFSYCDSGMILWLLVAEQICRSGQSLALVDARIRAFPCSGELNFRVADAPVKIGEILVAWRSCWSAGTGSCKP